MSVGLLPQYRANISTFSVIVPRPHGLDIENPTKRLTFAIKNQICNAARRVGKNLCTEAFKLLP